MTQILHVRCSPRGQAAESDTLARKVIAMLRRCNPGAVVVERVAGAIPHIDDGYATALGATGQTVLERAPQGSMVLSEALVRELESSDALVIGTPMHNYTVPSGLKAWNDHIVRARRTLGFTPDGKPAALRDRPVFVAVSSGARYSGTGARQPDFLTPYLRHVLGVIGLLDVTFFSIEGTAQQPDAVARAWAVAEQAVRTHFASHISGL
jgi:FMN-dependent NADH-azoreductase